MDTVIVVKAAYDAEAAVWYVEASDVPGLHLEGESLEVLVAKVPDALADLLADSRPVRDIPVEVVAHARTRVPAAA
jgi:predicted RNase H-like HicB family nuclease